MTTVSRAVSVAFENGLRSFGGATGINVGRIAVAFKTGLRARMDTTGLVDCRRCGADGQATDQDSGERGGDGAFAKFHGVSPQPGKRRVSDHLA